MSCRYGRELEKTEKSVPVIVGVVFALINMLWIGVLLGLVAASFPALVVR